MTAETPPDPGCFRPGSAPVQSNRPGLQHQQPFSSERPGGEASRSLDAGVLEQDGGSGGLTAKRCRSQRLSALRCGSYSPQQVTVSSQKTRFFSLPPLLHDSSQTLPRLIGFPTEVRFLGQSSARSIRRSSFQSVQKHQKYQRLPFLPVTPLILSCPPCLKASF